MRAPRGKLARLEALEDRARERAEAVEAAKDEQTRRALGLLRSEDLDALRERMDAGRARCEEIRHAARALEGPLSTHPAKEEAWAWALLLEDLPDGVPYPLPADPSGFAGYFEEEAGRCAELLARVLGVKPCRTA